MFVELIFIIFRIFLIIYFSCLAFIVKLQRVKIFELSFFVFLNYLFFLFSIYC